MATRKQFVLLELVSVDVYRILGTYDNWVEAKFRYWQAHKEQGKKTVQLVVQAVVRGEKARELMKALQEEIFSLPQVLEKPKVVELAKEKAAQKKREAAMAARKEMNRRRAESERQVMKVLSKQV